MIYTFMMLVAVVTAEIKISSEEYTTRIRERRHDDWISIETNDCTFEVKQPTMRKGLCMTIEGENICAELRNIDERQTCEHVGRRCLIKEFVRYSGVCIDGVCTSPIMSGGTC